MTLTEPSYGKMSSACGNTNPLIGTGYESFWLGPRLQMLWQRDGMGGINEAHNGYLQVYLNLGWVGLFLLVSFLIAGYWKACKRNTSSPAIASLGLAIWIVLLFYNMTEAAFIGGLLWLIFLLGTVVIPERAENRAPSLATIENSDATKPFPGGLLGAASLRR